MQLHEPYAFFREVLEIDLTYISQCMGAANGLDYKHWENILSSLALQFRDERNCWRPNAWVMVVEMKPVFLLECVDKEAFLTPPPSWSRDPRLMMLAWQASLLHLFIRQQKQEVCILLQASQWAESIALERLGCKITDMPDKGIGAYYFTCRLEDLRPVI